MLVVSWICHSREPFDQSRPSLQSVQATEDGSDELRRNSNKRNTSDGHSACSREHAADGGGPSQGNVSAPDAEATAAEAAVAAELGTDPFAAWRVAQGLATANNDAARAAGWAAAARLPVAALLKASAGAAMASEDNTGAVAGSFAFPLANRAAHPPAAWSGYGASLLNGSLTGKSSLGFAEMTPYNMHGMFVVPCALFVTQKRSQWHDARVVAHLPLFNGAPALLDLPLCTNGDDVPPFISLAGTTVQQPKPKRSSGGKGSAFTHAGTASGMRAENGASGGAGGHSKDGTAVVAMPVESRSSHDRLRGSESPCNNAEAPHKVHSLNAANFVLRWLKSDTNAGR